MDKSQKPQKATIKFDYRDKKATGFTPSSVGWMSTDKGARQIEKRDDLRSALIDKYESKSKMGLLGIEVAIKHKITKIMGLNASEHQTRVTDLEDLQKDLQTINILKIVDASVRLQTAVNNYREITKQFIKRPQKELFIHIQNEMEKIKAEINEINHGLSNCSMDFESNITEYFSIEHTTKDEKAQKEFKELQGLLKLMTDLEEAFLGSTKKSPQEIENLYNEVKSLNAVEHSSLNLIQKESQIRLEDAKALTDHIDSALFNIKESISDIQAINKEFVGSYHKGLKGWEERIRTFQIKNDEIIASCQKALLGSLIAGVFTGIGFFVAGIVALIYWAHDKTANEADALRDDIQRKLQQLKGILDKLK